MIGRVSWIILGVMATTTALGAAMVLPMVGAHRQALSEEPRVRSLVETVAAAELTAHGAQGSYHGIRFGVDDPSVALGPSDRAAMTDYAVEARQLPDNTFRVQAWPRPSALQRGRAAAISYYVDLSATGKILDRGWVGSDSAAE